MRDRVHTESFAGLSPRQISFLESHPYPQLFAVVSWGCAATAWLATVLNRHPDIYCVHAANLAWSVLGVGERVDGVQYARLLRCQGCRHIAAGDVHGVSRHLIPEMRETFGDRFNAVVVVREPAKRLQSQMALFDAFSDQEAAWDIGYVSGIIARTGVKLPKNDYRHRFFVHAANMLNAITEETAVGNIYRSEDLTCNPESLGAFMEEITRGAVSPDRAWLRSALDIERTNEHSGAAPDRDFQDWQMDVIGKVVDPRAWEIYESLGYPVSAVNSGLSALRSQVGTISSLQVQADADSLRGIRVDQRR